MTVQRFFVDPDQIDRDKVTFGDAQIHQMRRVLRLSPGDRVRVFDGVSSVDWLVDLDAAGRGHVVGECPQAREPLVRLVMYPSLLRRDKFEAVLQKLTEIGVAAICPVISARGLVREPPDERRLARWRAIVREASEQSGRGAIPQLLPARGFAEAIAAAKGTRIVAYERERCLHLSEVLAEAPTVVSAFIGPEGGFAPEEADCAARSGAHLITLGPRVFRTETASPILAALVLYELGDLT